MNARHYIQMDFSEAEIDSLVCALKIATEAILANNIDVLSSMTGGEISNRLDANRAAKFAFDLLEALGA